VGVAHISLCHNFSCKFSLEDHSLLRIFEMQIESSSNSYEIARELIVIDHPVDVKM